MNYILPRPDNTAISTPEHTFLRATSFSNTRLCGRTPTEPRPIRLSFARSHNKSTCVSQFGHTRASASIRGELIPPPNMDRPNDGQIKFNVDIGPMGVMGYDVVGPASNYADGGGEGEAHYTQRLESNRLLRMLERTLLIGGSIDAEALCVQSGVWVWRLVVDVSLVCDAGNALDACVLAVVAALRHFRLAQVDVVEDATIGHEVLREMQIIDSDEKEPTPLPLHHTPVTASFALFSDRSGTTSIVSALIDPTDREELAADGTVSWSYNKHGEMCCLDFPGGCELSPTQFLSSSELGKKRCIQICEILETALLEADSKAQNERMERLKKRGQSLTVDPRIDQNHEDVVMDDNTVDVDANAEDEEYRKLALDYASGHIAAAVKEGPILSGSNKKFEASSLFHAFLDSVKNSSSNQNTDESVPIEESMPMRQERSIIADQKARHAIAQQNAKVKTQCTNKTDKHSPMDDLSDEEENVVQLQSEFSNIADDKLDQPMKELESVKEQLNTKEARQTILERKQVKQKAVGDGEGGDVDELAMAVKKKKSKKSKKKN